jgi:hypothetical protein
MLGEGTTYDWPDDQPDAEDGRKKANVYYSTLPYCAGLMKGTVEERLDSRGLWCIGVAKDTIEKAPKIIPAPPAPATARPLMNMFEFTAVAQNKEPSSNRAKKPKKLHWQRVRESEVFLAASGGLTTYLERKMREEFAAYGL